MIWIEKVRKHIFFVGIIVFSILLILFAMNRFVKNDLKALEVWSQFSKRLFDDDLPKVKPAKEEEFDMTDI